MKKIVVCAGGTGGFVVLEGLKEIGGLEITAIPPTFDSGGSTGVLRDTRGALPQGDVRRHILGLSKVPDSFLRSLLTYRFSKVENGKGTDALSDHSLGNLILYGATQVCGNELEAIRKVSELFQVYGRVIPISVERAELCAQLADGSIIRGETNIDCPTHDGSLPIAHIFLEPPANICREAYEAIVEADLITFGPGDLYTSFLSITLVQGFLEALHKSSAKIVFIMNLMTKWGETHGFTPQMFCQKTLEYLKRDRFDSVIVNTGTIRPDLLKRYEGEKAYPVLCHPASLCPYAKCVAGRDLLLQTDIVRHDSHKLATLIVSS